MKKFKIFLSAIFFVIFLYNPLFAQELSPVDVVIKWTRLYGVDQDKASELTTLRFRDGKPKKTWVDETYKTIKQIAYKHLGGKIIGSKVNEMDAMIYLRSRIETIVGRTEQTEVYLMYKDNGMWLIEDIVVGEEEIKERGIIL